MLAPKALSAYIILSKGVYRVHHHIVYILIGQKVDQNLAIPFVRDYILVLQLLKLMRYGGLIDTKHA